MLSKKARYELTEATRSRYRNASRQEKKHILDEFSAATGYHRKYAITVLNNGHVPVRRKTGRPKVYPTTLDPILARVAEIYRWPCSSYLRDFLPTALDSLAQHQELDLSERDKALLLAMSAATIDRRLQPFRQQRLPLSRRRAKPATLALRKQIPVHTSADWDHPRPGFLESDLVEHNGGRSDGEYVHTLDVVDIATGWCDFEPTANRGELATCNALDTIVARLPFPLRGIDSDNDTAFINNHLKRYCERKGVRFTRSRPYRKNDQAHIEQKNWTAVRELIGYGRYDTPEALAAMRALDAVWRLFLNFFQPIRKIQEKERIDGKVHKRYDQAQTPYQRVLASTDVADETKEALTRLYRSLNPADLSRKLDTFLDALWALAR
jgi:hypothetical protein